MQIIPHLAAPGRARRAPPRYQLRRHVFSEQQDFLCLRPHIGDACFPKETDNPLHFFFSISHLLSLWKIARLTFLHQSKGGGRVNVIGLHQGLQLIEKKSAL